VIVRRVLVAMAALLASLGGGHAAFAQPAPTVAAAADLRPALTKIAAAFKRDTGKDISLIFGSSGNFHQQLQQGAPFQVFLSADEGYVLDLARAGRTIGRGDLYAIGRLAVVAPVGSPLLVDGKLDGLRRALASGTITRFAIANPEHAPYGKRAEEALRHAGLWPRLQSRLILGENVAQAAQFAVAGGAQGGIVAYALALDPALKGKARFALIPASWHQPLRQRMVLMKGANPVARQFYAYLRQPKARAVLAQSGFTLPAGSR